MLFRETPTNRGRLVCEFIGNVNIFEGEVVDDAEGHALITCKDLDRNIYGRQQWGILDNGRKPDPAMPRV